MIPIFVRLIICTTTRVITMPTTQYIHSHTVFTLYPTTLNAGESFMLWVEGHLPIIYKQSGGKYFADIPAWRAQALQRGIVLLLTRHDGRSCPPHVFSNMSETDTMDLQQINSCLLGYSDGDSSALVSSYGAPSPYADNSDMPEPQTEADCCHRGVCHQCHASVPWYAVSWYCQCHGPQ